MDPTKDNGVQHFMQSEQFAEYMAYLGWQHFVVGKNKKQFLYIRTLPGVGSLGKAPKITFPLPYEEIEQIAKSTNTMLVRIEPNVVLPSEPNDQAAYYKNLKDYGYGASWLDCELQTIRVDLRPDKEAIFASLPRENTRRNIRSAQKNQLVATESDDFDTFYALHQDVAKRKKFYCPPKAEVAVLWKSFSNSNGAKILTVYDKHGRAQVAILLIIYNKIAYYRYVGSIAQADDLRAPSLAVWECLLLAKKYGCEWFDFLGVNDPRHIDKKWHGFSHFKAGFSDNTVQFIEPRTKYYPPMGSVLHLFDRISRVLG